MSNILKRASAIALAMAMLVMGLAAVTSAASAQTGPWQWSDISDKLSVRENRPVWASAFAHPYWYLTDGQELYTGGRVWKTDGSVMTDITAEVRNAGLSRVDDIVTDGTTVIFLKNVVSATRNFEALSYKDGAWGYPAYTWQNRMDVNDSIASINGKNGVWIITTSKGKILAWNQANNAVNEITYNDKWTSSVGSMLYSVRHTSPIDGHNGFVAPIALPLGDQWLISYLSNNGTMRIWKVKLSNGQSVQTNLDITGQFESMQTIQAAASNGTQILLASSRYQNTATNKVYLYDGVNVKDVTAPAAGVPFSTWNKTIIENNGKSWMILNGKDLIRFDGSQFIAYGQTRDYFVTISGDKNGRFLLGGAVSAMGTINPTSPLTAKLVKVDESSGYVAVPAPVQTSNWVWSTMSVSHNQHNLYHGQSSNVIINSGSPHGINRVEIWLNGNVVKTCQSSTCDYTIYGSSYPKGSKLAFNGRAIDTKGHEAWTWLGEYSIPVDDYAYYNNNTTYDNTISTWFDSNVVKTTLLRNESRNITFYGNANRGLNRLELYANNALIGTCYFNNAYGNQSCTKTIYGSNYSAGQSVTLKTRAVDRDGNQNWSGTISFNIQDNTSNNNSGYVNSWMWLEPSDANLNQNETKTINVGAAAENGLQKIEIYADGGLKKTCTFNRAYGNQQCSVTINGSDFSANRNISILARAYDYYGRMAQTSSQNVYVTGTSEGNNNNQTNVDGNLTITSNRDSGYTNYEQITFTANGSDANGINKIEILVNAQVVKTCNGVGTCSYVGGPYNTETVSYGANLYDNLGNRTWTGYKTIYKK
jgi:hypothetical protein